MSRFAWCCRVVLLGGAAIFASATEPALAQEFLGIDPYNRPVYIESGVIPIVPSRITGPVYRRDPGQIGGPVVAGPLYYAEPAPAVDGFYRDDPLVGSGAVLAFDVDQALAQAGGERVKHSGSASRSRGPAPFTGDWYRYCEARYQSFDRESGTFQPSTGQRRLCR